MNASSRPPNLQAYEVMRAALIAVRPLIAAIERHDRDLGDQLRRAATSVLLNLAESNGVTGGNRTLRRRTALGSIYEVRAVLDAAVGLGYVDDGAADDALVLADRVGAMLYRLSR